MRNICTLVTTLALVSAARAESWRLVELPQPPSGWSVSAQAINVRGQIAGGYFNFSSGDFSSGAFFFDGRSWIDLGTLGGTNSFAYGLNNRGDVVGYADTAVATECYPSWDGGE